MNLPKGPEIKLPRRKKATDDSAGGSPQVPGFANDLYRDMRDRRLLLPALALLVAIFAVPMLLKASPEPAPLPPAAAKDKGLLTTAPAVTPEALVGVRDYRQRLAALKQRNPFDSPFKAPEVDPTATPDDAAAAGASTDPGVTTDPTTAPSDTTTQPEPNPNGDYLVAPQLDIEFGPVGDRRTINGVNLGDLVPGEDNAVAMFVGTSTDLSVGQFLLTRDVTKVTGEGKCQGGRPCEFLALAEGDTAYLTIGPNDRRFSISIKEIRRVVVDQEGNPVDP